MAKYWPLLQKRIADCLYEAHPLIINSFNNLRGISMKKSSVLMAIMVLAVLSAGLAYAQGIPISVVGKGVVDVKADTTMITVVVNSSNDNQTEARAEVQQKLNDTRDALLAAGIKEDEILPSQGGSVFSYQGSACRSINNTTICTYSNLSSLERTLMVQMQTADQSEVNKVIDAAESAGASAQVSGYGLKDAEKLEKARKQALAKADENAKDKAQAYASGEGLKLGELLNRNEIPPLMCSMDDLEALDLESAGEPGMVKVRACVAATYLLLPLAHR
jgi:uncharacterized protein YggE